MPRANKELHNMELISYNEFGRLRLRDFSREEIAESDIPDWEWMGGLWYCDSVGFTWFGCLNDMPKETGGLEVDFGELPEHEWLRILNSLHLPLREGMTFDEIVTILGQPFKIYTFVEDRKIYEFKVGSAYPYRVSCIVLDNGGL
jgi:hypothetical protein